MLGNFFLYGAFGFETTFASGQTHYKCIQHKTGSQTRFSGSKSRNNALHADCCKVTIELPAHAVAAIRVFLPQKPFLRANFT